MSTIRVRAVPERLLPDTSIPHRAARFVGWREVQPGETPDHTIGGDGVGLVPRDPAVARAIGLVIIKEGVVVESGTVIRRAIADGDLVEVKDQ